MGKNNANSWLNAVKKAFRSPSNDHEKRSSRRREENEQEQEQEQENKRVKRRWIFRKNLPLETTIQHNVAQKPTNYHAAIAICTDKSAQNLVKKQPKFDEVEIVKKETKAAVVIQTIFRGYLARRALLALKGVVKLQALIRGYNVRLRAKTTLKCIESLVRVQNRVCDQRRRLSFEATNSRKSISRNTSTTPHTIDDHPFALDEIQSLVKKAKECSLKQDHKILAHALSHQMWRSNEDYFINQDEFEEKHRYQPVRKDRNLCNQTDPIKILEIDTSTPYNHRSRYQHSYSNSPKTPSSSNLRSIQAYYSCSPRLQKPETTLTPCSNNHLHIMSIGEKCCHVAKPNYMASTESAKARVRSNSTPRMSPRREQMGSAKKRLSFNDGQNEDDKMHDERMDRSIYEKTSCYTY